MADARTSGDDDAADAVHFAQSALLGISSSQQPSPVGSSGPEFADTYFTAGADRATANAEAQAKAEAEAEAAQAAAKAEAVARARDAESAAAVLVTPPRANGYATAGGAVTGRVLEFFFGGTA